MSSRSAKRRRATGRARGNPAARPRPIDVRAVRFEIEGDEYAILSVPVRPASPLDAALTPAERDVIALLLAGRSNAQIAAARATSARTVANQVAAIYKKLGVTSRREIAALSQGVSAKNAHGARAAARASRNRIPK